MECAGSSRLPASIGVLKLNRTSIQRSDFPTSRRGYDTAAVDAHLRELADAAEAAPGRDAGRPMATAASEQVHRIVEAAETMAQQMQTEADEQAREQVARVTAAAAGLLERIGAMHDELGRLMDQLRALEGDAAGLGGSAPPAPVDPDPDPDEILEPEVIVPEVLAPAEPPAPSAEKPADEEAARLVALDMALGGTPREETEAYLAEHYALPDPGRVLDDVYALAGT